jgi:hypothetical protein
MLQRITEILQMMLYFSVVAVGRCLNRHHHDKAFLIYTALPKRILVELEGKQSFGCLQVCFVRTLKSFKSN